MVVIRVVQAAFVRLVMLLVGFQGLSWFQGAVARS